MLFLLVVPRSSYTACRPLPSRLIERGTDTVSIRHAEYKARVSSVSASVRRKLTPRWSSSWSLFATRWRFGPPTPGNASCEVEAFQSPPPCE
jgi:hypothetical protein